MKLKFEILVELALLILFIVGIISFKIISVTNIGYVTAKIVKTERITYRGGNGYYLIFTNKEVFKNKDSTLLGKWDSSDLYAKLIEGKTYSFKVCGFRIPFLSEYRNIISFDEVTNGKI
jgi:hypothetical protein